MCTSIRSWRKSNLALEPARRQLVRFMRPRDPSFGLCGSCRYRREVIGRLGATYLLCRRSESDSNYPKYPRLPLLRCAGYEEGEGEGEEPESPET